MHQRRNHQRTKYLCQMHVSAQSPVKSCTHHEIVVALPSARFWSKLIVFILDYMGSRHMPKAVTCRRTIDCVCFHCIVCLRVAAALKFATLSLLQSILPCIAGRIQWFSLPLAIHMKERTSRSGCCVTKSAQLQTQT